MAEVIGLTRNDQRHVQRAISAVSGRTFNHLPPMLNRPRQAFDEPSGKQGFGIFRAGDGTFPTPGASWTNITTVSIELVNSDELNPVVAAQVSAVGPPVRYDRLIANESGIYRWAFKANIRMDSPAAPPPPYSYDDLIGKVTGTVNLGTGVINGDAVTQNLCGNIARMARSFHLMKGASFSTPSVADSISHAEVNNLYFCAGRTWGDFSDSGPIELEAGDTLSIWWDNAANVGSGTAAWQAVMSLHYQGTAVELS